MWRALLILFLAWRVSGQTTTLQWLQTNLPAYHASASAVAVDSLGNVIAVGTFQNSVDFGTGVITNTGGFGIFVVKYTHQGAISWIKSFGTLNDFAYGVAIDSQNNIVAVGTFQGSLDFGGGPLIPNGGVNADAFVVKLSPNGSYIWATNWGSPASDTALAVAIDTNDNVIATSQSGLTVNFNGGISGTGHGGVDVALVKFRGSNGTTLWGKIYGGTQNDSGNSLACDRNGDVLVTGSFGGSGDLGGTPIAGSKPSGVFIAKYSGVDGSFKWSRIPGGTTAGGGITSDPATTNIFVTGGFGGGSVDFGNGIQPVTPIGTTAGLFIVAYDQSGNYLWSNANGGNGDTGLAIACDGNGHVAFSGLAGGFVNFTFSGTNMPGSGLIMASFTTSGSFLWARRANINSSPGNGIAFAPLSHVVVAGEFHFATDFGGITATPSVGAYNVFVAQYTQPGSGGPVNWYVDSSKTGSSDNSGTSPQNAFTNWVPLGGTDGQWTGKAHGGDTIWVFPGVGYVGNRTGVPDAINMYNISGLPNAPITFKAIQSSGLVKTPPLLVSGSYFTFDGRLSDTYTNVINFDNLANLYQITNNINWWLRGVYGFGSNVQNGIYMPNAGYRAKFQWLHVDPYTYNTNNYPFGNNSTGPGSTTHGVNILQNTGEHLDGGEIAYCYIEEADQCGINILNNNAPTWGGFRIHHNVITKQGDAGARLSGGMEVDHNIIGHPWTIHGHPNGIVMSPNYSYFHHNIVFDTLDTMFYTPGGGSPMIAGIKVYNNLFYTDKTWSFIYTNEFSSNLPFVNHSVGGLQFLVEANANNFEPWLPQIWTNIYFANNTFICGNGGVATNGNAGINSAVSLPNRYAPGNSLSVDPGLDRGFIYLTNMLVENNLIYNVSAAGSGQTLGGFQGWVDRFSKDQTTWTNPAITSTAGILFDNANVNGLNLGSTNVFLDYNVLTADQAASKVFAYNGPFSTNFTFATAEAFNAVYTTNGYIHNSSSVPSLVDTNYYDFHPKVSDTVLVGKGTNVTPWASANGGLPQVNMDLSGQTRSTWSVGAYEPQTDLVLHLTFEDMFPATGSVAFATSPFTTDITGYGGTMGYYGFISTPTNWPAQVLATNTLGPGYKYAAQFVSNTNQVPAYGNFPICQFGAITNIGALSNLSAITISVWMKYFSSQGDTRDNSSTIIDTCEGSPGAGATWSLGRNSAYQTSFSLFTNLDYNTGGDLHANYPDNESTDWHHYAATFNTTNKVMNIYLDGTNCGSRDLTGYSTALTNLIVGVPSSGGSYAGKNGWIAIGCRTHVGSPNLADADLFPNNGWMDGQVEDLRVYNRALGAGEILAIYNSAVPSPGQGVIVLPKDPIITLNPLSQTVTAPATATFTATASSTNSLTYQWFKNGSLIAGATQTTFTTPTTTTADNGSTFFMVATAGGRTAQSSTAILTVGAPLPQDPIITLNPVGQTVTAPATATFTSTASSTQALTFQWSKNGTPIAGATQTTYTTPPTATSDNGSTFFMVATAGGRTVQSGTAVLTVNAPGPQDPRITLNPVNQSVTAPAAATFTSTATSTQALTFQWSKNGTPIAGATQTTFTTPATSTADNGSTYFMVATAGGRSVQSATATLTVNAPGPQDPLITLNPLDQSVITPATATFTSSATSTQALTFQWFRSGVAIAGATHTSFTTPATTSADNGSTYFMVATAGGRTAQSTTATLTVGTPGPQDPLITSSPVSQSVTAPATATFTASATSTNTLAFQWYKSGVLIFGATNTSFTTPPTSTSDNGSTYFMVATAGGRTDQSATATLTVFPQGPQDPIITLNPLSQFVIAPALATFTSTASSTNSLVYQWYKNGSAVAGATSTTYSTATAITDNGSTWFMIATASGRSVQSSTAILSVSPNLGIVLGRVTNLKASFAQTPP